MKIGLCLRTWGEGGGIGVYTRNIVRSLLSLDCEHEFVLFYQDKAHLGQFGHCDRVTEVLVSAPGKLAWDQVAIPYHAAKAHVDVLFHPKMTAPLAARCKTVTVVHGSERFVFPHFSHRGDLLYFKTLYPLLLRKASAIISVSENARKDLIRFLHINPHKIQTIYMAAAGNFRRIDDPSGLELVREKYRLPGRFILNVGLIYPGKNIPNLLRALQIVRREMDVKLVLAGVGRRMHHADLRWIETLGLQQHVVLPGYIPSEDIVAVYNLASAVVFPSFYESFGLVNLEANACGSPLITSRTGGAPEAAGDAALYVDPFDAQDIASAILSLLANDELRDDLVQKGLRNVRRFSWQQSALKTLRLFEELSTPTH